MKQDIAQAKIDLSNAKVVLEALVKAEEVLVIAGKAEVRAAELETQIKDGQKLIGELGAEAEQLTKDIKDGKAKLKTERENIIASAEEKAKSIEDEAKAEAKKITAAATDELVELQQSVAEQRELLKLLQDETAEAIAEKQKADAALAASREAVAGIMGNSAQQ
jgi:cell division septum initiation protein DivIVA